MLCYSYMLHALHYHSFGFFIITSTAEGLHFSALVTCSFAMNGVRETWKACLSRRLEAGAQMCTGKYVGLKLVKAMRECTLKTNTFVYSWQEDQMQTVSRDNHIFVVIQTYLRHPYLIDISQHHHPCFILGCNNKTCRNNILFRLPLENYH